MHSKQAIILGITEPQEANLRKLAAHLTALPADYEHFEMEFFMDATDGIGDIYAVSPEETPCGAVACAVGHGPRAGIPCARQESWGDFGDRAFGPSSWPWCFAAAWSRVDNTAHGAAKRIIYMLEQGIPDTFHDAHDDAQLYAIALDDAPLPYLATVVPPIA